jgi:hypothetical protein
MPSHAQRCAQIGLALLLGCSSVALAQEAGWERHFDREYGHRYDIPAGIFEQVESQPGKLVFEETDGGRARLSIYSGNVPPGMTLGEFESRVQSAEWIRDVTYRAGEAGWFVVSGHYRTKGQEDEPLIFYTKFMLSPDRERYAAIEITYPLGRKAEFDPIVRRLEKGLRPPS